MARLARGRGCGRCGRETAKAKDLSTSEPCRGRKYVEHLISEVFVAYQEGTDIGIRNLLEEWEEEIKQNSETEEEIEN